MACVEACKRSGRTEVIVTQRELLKMAGKPNSQAWLLKTLDRLTATAIRVTDKRYTYTGSLIHDAVRDERTGHIMLNINPKMLVLFGTGTTHIDFEHRQALASDLSKWLHGYVLSHKATWRKPHFVGLDKVQELCGSSATIRKFRQQIRQSMTELKEQKIIAGWKLENDILKLWK